MTKRSTVATLLLVAFCASLTGGCARYGKGVTTWSGYESPEARERREMAEAQYHALQDSAAFFKAMDDDRHSEALKILWSKTNVPLKAKRSTTGTLAGIAASVAGLGLVLAASEQIGNIDDAIDATPSGFDTTSLNDSRGTWQVVRITGFATAILGVVAGVAE